MPNEFVNPALRPPLYFYHIPKTGGTSLRGFLADQYPDQDRCPAEDWKKLAGYDQAALARFRLFYGPPLGQPERLSSGWRSHPDVPAQPGRPDHIDDPAP